ncbi:MAG: ABC transporter permease, partial [Bdellovibrionota bacterium]
MSFLGLFHLVRFVGLRSLFSHPGRTALTILSVAAGIALSTSISLINEATLRFFRESFDSALGRTSLSISGGDSGFSEDLINPVEGVPGVQSAVPVVETRAWTDAGENLTLFGVDLLREKSVRSYRSSTGRKIIGDAMSFIAQPDSIILAESFAAKHHLKLDDTLRLSTVKGKVDFKIRGLLAPEGLAKAHGGHLVIMDVDAARLHFGKLGATDRIDVVVEEGADVAIVAERIRVALGPGLTVERPELQSEHSERMLKSFQIMLRFFGTLALLVGGFLIANTVNISVTERRKEIGTLRAIGTPRRMILLMIVGESGVIGALGALVGAPLGRLMATVMVDSVSRAMTLTQQN